MAGREDEEKQNREPASQAPPQPPTIAFNNPYDLPLWRKLVITACLAGITFTVTFASSVFSSTIAATAHQFHTTTTVMILGVSLYVLGFALGPLCWGPLSEAIPTALVSNLGGLLVCRFLAGAFGSAPLVLVTACFADFWGVAARGTASAVYATTTFMGPTFGPIIGVYITEGLGWRWTAWITGIMALFFGIPASSSYQRLTHLY
ncbi:putative transporter [Cyphellophora attinorum]|uniref:Putative transporter n=1 Tax=Cyphellophora attinorum TaxID=1664694 RepID=A0A0N1I1S6_9EURO|nr:putative transporter [Phialophora attinorum]KPI45916.1 putative transporter [Phialophora attinorum]